MTQLRKLIFGETWSLPIGLAVALGAAAVIRAVEGKGGWWHRGGGFLLLGLVVVALSASLADALRRRSRQ